MLRIAAVASVACGKRSLELSTQRWRTAAIDWNERQARSASSALEASDATQQQPQAVLVSYRTLALRSFAAAFAAHHMNVMGV